MKRRGFLGFLAALPFAGAIARAGRAVAAVPRRLFKTAFVGKGEGATHRTLYEAIRDVEPGGTVYLLPGHVETINEPLNPDGKYFVRFDK